ncbi:uncharacterized protein LOC121865075 [Homarus americanus]|uniref:uncharacterized protein LOC121865075 n=1 Tax=Homarus americanus TaxID=6706 RepID=UPI001C44BD3F|nr:uncharacterized protein LOC121865075 [Homarus americanus]
MTMVEYVASPRGILKICHMVFVLIVLGTWFGYTNTWRDFVTGTVFLAFFSGIILFAQNMLLGPSRVAEILTSGLLTLFFFVSGICVLAFYSGSPVPDACGSFCFFTSIIYGIDVYFAFQIEVE